MRNTFYVHIILIFWLISPLELTPYMELIDSWGISLKYKLIWFSRVVKIDPTPVSENYSVPAHSPGALHMGISHLPLNCF